MSSTLPVNYNIITSMDPDDRDKHGFSDTEIQHTARSGHETETRGSYMTIKASFWRLPVIQGLIMAVAIMTGQVLIASPAWAATYYVATNGSNTNAGSSAAPFQTIQKGLSVLSAGDTLVIRNGTYSGSSNSLANLPSGSAGNYITIMAENEGGVIITAGMGMSDTDRYLVFQGLRIQDSTQKNILGNHIKWLRTEFKGGPSGGNTMSVVIGNNDVGTTADILLEDVWVHGFGGRYKILVYNSSRVVVRRAVTRYDGTVTASGEPQANITVYDSDSVEIQNSIAIDGITGTGTEEFVAAYYNICNGTGSVPVRNYTHRGNIALKPTGYTMASEGNCTISNEVVMDVAGAGGTYGISQLKGSGTQYTRVTLIGSRGDGFGIFGGSAKVQDSVVANQSGQAYNGVTPSTSVAYNNSGGNSGGTVLNPFTSGLLYLPRIEAGSVLSAGGTAGQRGAQIIKRIGTPGTLYGESGYSTTTATDLWPWPNEARIKKEMCADAGVTRGFCSSASLTAYVFDYLGNPNPYGSVISLSPPGNLRVQ